MQSPRPWPGASAIVLAIARAQAAPIGTHYPTDPRLLEQRADSAPDGSVRGNQPASWAMRSEPDYWTTTPTPGGSGT